MDTLDFATRIVIALLLGMFIGFERQITGHPAGIRTNMLICLGSCMFLLFPMIMGSDDIQRVASYIVSGVGFLCSGVIFKENGTVKGLNTAATLWCTAAIGLLSSSGMYSYAFIATFILLMANILFRPLSQKIEPLDSFNEDESFYKINVVCHEKDELKVRSEILKEIKGTKLTLTELDTKELENNKVQIEATYRFIGQRVDETIESLVATLSIKHGIKKVGWEII
ncbi:MAG: MgtC/SapB family protein [Bacilli bacterium]|nr:MgtC/SapB family protein [Bacilli bacterium]